MINKVVINNFKKFEHLEFDLPDHLVIAGPNNSGKTTLLQAIAAWAEFAFQWSNNNPDLAREADGNYRSTSLNMLRFYSVPLTDFDHLWKSKDTRQPASIWLYTKKWKIGFEILYKEQELANIRPAKSVDENDLEHYLEKPVIPIYLPPLSGININETFYQAEVIPARLARAQAGSILRNILLVVSQDNQKWQTLQEIVHSFFGYELLMPSKGENILARYRHSAKRPFYDLSSAASGFLQVLLIYAALLYKNSSVVLVDEPDAHLHILLQEKMYRSLQEYARQTGSQLIISTHSERLINVADPDSLHLLAGELRKVNDKRKIRDTLGLENTEIMLAETEPGILYIEGLTDIPILREWARILQHRLLQFLDKPFAHETAEDNWPTEKHFSAMRLMVPGLLGAELQDGDKSPSGDKKGHRKPPDGMLRLFWTRREIENYLIHPEAIYRFVDLNAGKEAAKNAMLYMKDQLPPALYKNPFDSSHSLHEAKGKILLANIFNQAGLDIKETDYYQLAAQMKKDEIHPEVVEKLDAIAKHFDI